MNDEDSFVTDATLGKLTTYMRMAGYDVTYAPDEGAVEDNEVTGLAQREGHTVLTRDVELAEKAEGILLESEEVTNQLLELKMAGLTFELTKPSRCSVCNGSLSEGGKDEAPEDVSESWECDDCGKVHWEGTHWEDVRDTFESLS